jgi:tetratricopeptide (TPR) repeat protein
MYFPFVDNEVEGVLRSTMKRAYNYADFVKLLAGYVCAQEVTTILSLLAMKHSQNVCDIDSMNIISQRYGSDILIAPIFHMCYSCIHGVPHLNEAEMAAQNALDTGLEDWLELEMLILKFKAGGNQRSGGPEEEESMDAIDSLLLDNNRLDCFSPEVLYLKAARMMQEGRKQESITYLIGALDKAEEIDDRFATTRLSRALSGLVDSSRAKELLLTAMRLCEDLGIGVSKVHSALGRVHELRGEYNAALEQYQLAQRLSEPMCRPDSTHAQNIADIYNKLGNGEAALEWAKMAAIGASHSDVSGSSALRTLARAQIQVGQTDLAATNLETAMGVAMKRGYETHLASSYLIQGLLEKEQNEFEDARSSIARALDIYSRLDQQSAINDCMLQLAEIEVAMAPVGRANMTRTRARNSLPHWLKCHKGGIFPESLVFLYSSRQRCASNKDEPKRQPKSYKKSNLCLKDPVWVS